MVDLTGFSPRLLAHPEARNAAALDRIRIGKRRVQNVLDQDVVAVQKTLEQKISDQGPKAMRVDPHLLGLSIMDLEETKRLKRINFAGVSWFSNPGTPDTVIQPKLLTLGPIYTGTHHNGFGNLIGDALEVVVYKILRDQNLANPRFGFLGGFDLDAPKNAQGRYIGTRPPKSVNGGKTTKEADFILFGHNAGTICIECKNYREWLYPNSVLIKNLIMKSYDLNCIPLMMYRRIHYSTISNFFKPAGIIAHETYNQYYPSSASDLARDAQDARKLGFTDITSDENPRPRTINFLTNTLLDVVSDAAILWNRNRVVLRAYADNQISIEELYRQINSRAAS